MVIIINGVARSGKDTVISMCQEYLKKYNVYSLSSIDPIKKIVNEFLKKDNIQKTDAYRKLLSDIKNSLTEYNNFSYHWIVDQVTTLNKKNSKYNIFFIQCREPSEIQKFKNTFSNCKTLLVTKPNLHIPNNDSDKNVFNFDYDYTIINNGTLEELRQKVILFCNLEVILNF